MNANILGNAGIGISQGLEKGLQNAYRINRQGFSDRQAIQKAAEDSQYKQQDMSMRKQEFEQKVKEYDYKIREFDIKLATMDQYAAFDAYSVDGDVSHLNNLLKKSPLTKERANAIRFEKLNPTNQEDTRLLATEYGLDEITPEAAKSYIKAIKPDGTVQIMPMQGLYTLTGYAKTKDAETRAKLAEEASLAHVQAQTKKLNAEASSLGSPDGLKSMQIKEAQRKERGAIMEDIATNNPEVIGKAVMGNDNDIDFDGTVIPVAQLAKAAQGDNKLSATDRQYLDGLYDATTSFKAIETKLKSDTIDRNAVKKAWAEIASITGADYAKMSEADKTQFIDKLSLDSETRLAAAAFIKAMSGAAVSDSERAYYLDLITKGDWSTKEASLATIKGFREGLNRSYVNKLDSLKNFTPYEVYTRRGQVKSILGETTKEPSKNQPIGKPPLPNKNMDFNGTEEDYKTPPPPIPNKPESIPEGTVVKYGNQTGTILKNVNGIITLKLQDGTTVTVGAAK